MSNQGKPEKDKNRDRRLRTAAEKTLTRTPSAPGEMTGKTVERVLHELHVHQVELEMQNEELKRAQVALEESRDKYLDLYDFAPVGYFTLTRAGHIAEVNLAGAALLGVERPKLVRRGLARFVAPGDLDRWDQHLVSVLHSAEKQICELMFKREEGSTFHAHLDSLRLDRPTQEAGAGAGPVIRVAMSDISERKRAEEKLTEALAQLVRSNKELENFAYTASHDLKGPLITITGFLRMLAVDTERGNAERMHVDMARIGEATKKMDRLLNDLLELSRIGHVADSLEDVSLTRLAREVVKLLAGPVAERGVRVEISPDLPTVHGERARLTQLLMNLLGNAVKFMGEQPNPHVKIGVRRDGKETVCYVRDNGIGIAPQHTESVFELFRQLDPSRGGTGIGLIVARRVVAAHGGRVWIESDGPGTGTTVCFTLAQRAGPVTEEEQDNGRRTLARVADRGQS